MQAREKTGEVSASKVLTHPLRVRILEVANEHDISAVRFVNDGLAPPGCFEGKSPKQALSWVAYHFRALAQAGCIEEVGTRYVRGSVEHIYRGVARATFSAEEWERLDPERRLSILRTMYQGLAARIETALRTGSFDSRSDSHLTYTAMEVDEQGWDELVELGGEQHRRTQLIRKRAERRIEEGADGFPVTVGGVTFPSPAPASGSA